LSNLDRYKHLFRNLRLLEWHNDLTNWQDKMEHAIGGLPNRLVDDPAHAAHKVSVPPAATFQVVGIDGKFVTFISNPQNVVPPTAKVAQQRFLSGINIGNAGILHNLQSATDLNFNQSSSLKDYGTSPQLMWTDQDPNVTRFFRLRSSYDGKTWNAWQFYGNDAVACGPIGVWSGVLRSAGLSQVNASSTPTTKPLSASAGGAANQSTISVAAFLVQYPNSISPATNGKVSYHSGAVTPLLDSTLYMVYCVDLKYAGGVQTYLATTDPTIITSLDGVVYLGNITTPAFGGGGTTGGGGGNGPPGGVCFSGNTLVITKDGLRPIRDIIGGWDQILTQRGWRKVKNLIEHDDYSGPMCDMGSDEYVTPPHRFWWRKGWVRAEFIFIELPQIPKFTAPVFNLEIEGDGSDDEQCYVLANGWIAHNFQKL
jgi:hypothetical protein